MRTIKGSLSVAGINSIIRKLQEYSDSLDAKNGLFIDLLLERGIRVAQESVAEGTHTMPQRIVFEKEIEQNGSYVIGVIIGEGTPFPSDWVDSEGNEHHDMVYPMAMMEFGSAGLALPEQEAFGGYGGQGTFSVTGNETSQSWYVTKIDEAGNRVTTHATAIAPTQPMFNAMEEMKRQILECARTAFGGGKK